MRSTQEVLDHHLQSFGEGIDSILSDYDDQSNILSQQGSFESMEDIKAFFTAFVTELPAGFMNAFTVTNTIVHGEIAFIIWKALPWFPLGTDTFVIKNGKILYQTFSAYTTD